MTATINVQAPPMIVLNDLSLGQDLQQSMNITLPVAPSRPVTVTVTSQDASLVTISTDNTLAGSASVTFANVTQSFVGSIFLQGRRQGSTTIQVQAAGYADGTSTMTITPAGVVWITSDFSTTTFSAPTALNLRTVRLQAGTLAVQQAQALRGGLAMQVAIQNATPTVGTILTTPVQITGGSSNASTQFMPNSAGTTLLTLNTPAGFSTPASNQQITATVTAPALSLASVAVGKDLQQSLNLFLPAAPPTPTDVTLTSSDGTIAVLTTDGLVAGTASVTFPGVTGTFVGSVFVQGRALGTATLTLQAAGYTTGNSVATVQPAGFVFNFTTINTVLFAGPTQVSISPGRLQPGTLIFQQVQAVRGGFSVQVPVSSTVPDVGDITPSPVVLNGGASSVLAQFTPSAVGTTRLNLGTPSGFSTPSSSQQITANVTLPTINLGNVDVGQDLQQSLSVFLTAAPPTATDVTITSADGTIATLSSDGTLVGGSSVTLPGVTGTFAGTLVVQGRALGNTTLTARATNYADGTNAVTVTPAGFFFVSTDFTTTTFSPNTTLSIASARLQPTTFAFQQRQPVRARLSVPIPVSSSNTRVGVITLSPVVFPGNQGSGTTALDPLTAGTTLLTLNTPAGFSTPNTSQQITATVTAPALRVSAVMVGRDLQESQSLFLPVAPPGPVDVTITSSAPAIATLTADGTVAGGDSVTFPGVTGAFVGTIFVQGRGLGSVNLRLQASGYTDGINTVTVTPAGFLINNPGNFTTAAGAPNTTIQVIAGRLLPNLLTFQRAQAVRGGLTVDVTLQSSNAAVGTLSTTLLRFMANTVSTVTQFRPLAPGTTGLSVDMPTGFVMADDRPEHYGHRDAVGVMRHRGPVALLCILDAHCMECASCTSGARASPGHHCRFSLEKRQCCLF